MESFMADYLIIALLLFLCGFILVVIIYSLNTAGERNSSDGNFWGKAFFPYLKELIVVIFSCFIAVTLANQLEQKSQLNQSVALFQKAIAYARYEVDANKEYISRYKNGHINADSLTFCVSKNTDYYLELINREPLYSKLRPCEQQRIRYFCEMICYYGESAQNKEWSPEGRALMVEQMNLMYEDLHLALQICYRDFNGEFGSEAEVITAFTNEITQYNIMTD